MSSRDKELSCPSVHVAMLMCSSCLCTDVFWGEAPLRGPCVQWIWPEQAESAQTDHPHTAGWQDGLLPPRQLQIQVRQERPNERQAQRRTGWTADSSCGMGPVGVAGGQRHEVSREQSWGAKPPPAGPEGRAAAREHSSWPRRRGAGSGQESMKPNCGFLWDTSLDKELSCRKGAGNITTVPVSAGKLRRKGMCVQEPQLHFSPTFYALPCLLMPGVPVEPHGQGHLWHELRPWERTCCFKSAPSF